MLKVPFPTSEPTSVIQGMSLLQENHWIMPIFVLCQKYITRVCFVMQISWEKGKKEIIYFLKPFKRQVKLDQTWDVAF